MATSEINIPPTVKKSKLGLLGKILGGIAGAVAGAFSGGAAAGPVAAGLSSLGGAASGMGIGGTVGEAIDPSKQEQGYGVGKVESSPAPIPEPIQRETKMSRYALADPEIQTKLIKDSIQDVLKHPRLTPEAKEEYQRYGLSAIDRLRVG